MPDYKEFKVNEFITLKLEDEVTNIYINGEIFNQCKFLLLQIPVEDIEELEEIDSIDEVAEQLRWTLEGQRDIEYQIHPETEFFGHCSNLQAWVEHNYDTRLLHSNLAFPLLKKLSQIGDPLANRVFKEEIAKRLESGFPSVVNYLKEEGFIEYLDAEFRGAIIPQFEVNALQQIEDFMLAHFKLVEDFDFNSLIENEDAWYEITYDDNLDPRSLLFMVENNRVETLVIIDLNYCDTCEESFLKSKYIEEGIEYDFNRGEEEICKSCGIIIPDEIEKFSGLKKLFIHSNEQFKYYLIPDSLSKLHSLEVLYLYSCSSEHLPELISNLPSLKVLIINEFPLEEIPESTTNLKNLEILNLKNTWLKELPKFTSKLISLRECCLDNNSILSIPESIFKLQSLRILSLNNNKISIIPETIGNLENLEVLSLNNTKINELFKTIGNFKYLRVLNLEQCGLTSLPNTIRNLEHLETLSLNNTKLNELPETIGNLKNLRVLNIKNCNLRSLPDSITELKKLTTIDIKGNILSKLSHKIATYLLDLGLIAEKDIIYLQIDKVDSAVLGELETTLNIKLKLVKKMSTIKLLFTHDRINEFVLEDNKVVMLRLFLSELPKSITKLKSLRILEFYGQLSLIPSFIGELQNLETLVLKRNHIIEISNLENLVNLKRLDLSRNELTEIKGLTTLTNLRNLDLNQNEISEINGFEFLQNLEVLNLSYNQITEIRGLETLHNLIDLELSNNQITEIKGLRNLTKLRYLSLNKNQIDEIKGLENLTDLWRITIFGNKFPNGFLREIGKDGVHDEGEKYVNYCQRKIVESQNLKREYVQFKGKKFYVWNKVLLITEEGVTSLDDLEGLENIRDIEILDLSSNEITEIKYLGRLTNLKELRLRSNKIMEIKDLETLSNLEILNLRFNLIKEIKGLQTLKNLKELYLNHNPTSDIKGIGHLKRLKILWVSLEDPLAYSFWNMVKYLMGDEYYRMMGIEKHGVQYHIKNPQKVVEFCSLKDEKIRNTDIKIDDILQVLSDKKIHIIREIANLLNQKDKWDIAVIRDLLLRHKIKFIMKTKPSHEVYWKLK